MWLIAAHATAITAELASATAAVRSNQRGNSGSTTLLVQGASRVRR